jgi:hypothetical protein
MNRIAKIGYGHLWLLCFYVLLIVLCLVYPTLPVSLGCLRPVSCVPNVASVSGLFIICINVGYYADMIFNSIKRLNYWREDNPETLATLGTQDTGRRQSRDTDNIGYTRHRTKTIQRHWQHWVHKTQCYQCLWIVFVLCLVYPMLPVSLDCLCPVSCVSNVTSVSGLSSSLTLDTQDTGRRQSRDTGNIGYTRHRTTTIQRHW